MPSLFDAFKQYISDAKPGGLLNPEVPPGGPTELAKGLLGFTPVVGDAISGYDAIQSARQGDYLGAALNGVGLLPFVPAMGGVIKKAPRAEAMETARKNAVKMLGLPENNTAMDRAKALGFLDDAYHGTGRVFDSFNKPKGIGNVSNTYDSNMASFLSSNPKISNEYSVAAANAENATAYVKGTDVFKSEYADEAKKIIENKGLSNRHLFTQYLDKLIQHGPSDALDVRFMEISGVGNGAANVIPLKVRMSNMIEHDYNGKLWNEYDVGNIIKQSSESGKDGVIIKNIKDGLTIGDSGTTYAITNPSIIRSRFAAFDPSRINEADLLGQVRPDFIPWLIGTGLLGGYFVKSQTQDQ